MQSEQWTACARPAHSQVFVPSLRTSFYCSHSLPLCSLPTVHCSLSLHPGQVLSGELVELGVEYGERLLHHLRLALHDDEVERALNDIFIG